MNASGRASLLLLSLLACAVLDSACSRQSGGGGGTSQPAADLPYDHALTDVARLLGGLPPEETTGLANVTSREAWQDYRKTIDASWAAEQQQRFQSIATWRDRELRQPVDQCRALFYPFSGPDILHAMLFFPRCDTYVLFGLEHLGSVPQLGRLPAARIDRLVGDLQSALADFFTRHYFITRDMMVELTESDLDGVTPLLLMLLARMDAHIAGVDQVALTDAGGLVPVGGPGSAPGAKSAIVGSRVRFVAKGGDRPQAVIYFRVPADNAGLARQPRFRTYIQHLAPTTTFLKSASYLLHTESFSSMRSLILENSSVILEDDSGVPYRFLASPPWRVTLYGQYAKPIADFNYGFQPDLQAAYAEAGTPPPLPFSFGYHWRDGSWGVILAVRGGTAVAR